MIDKDNFKVVLAALGFSENKNIFYKYFSDGDFHLSVDFNDQRLIYPIDKGFIVSGEFTTGFGQRENFVVFECVHRLLMKGYKPEHLELEPKWTVGHGASGGRADIMVKDNSGKSILIIECKTAGKEFDDEWKKTKINGGQLFSYAKQAGSTQFVALYSSDLIGGNVTPFYYLVTLKDNAKLLDELSDKKPLSYEAAKLLDKEDIYKAWKETYAFDFATQGLFENNIPAYEIGKTKYSIADLKPISNNDIQGKYHQFATILRQYNVSGRENAFDKLVNLFLCKIVDETTNPNELRFYWKGVAYDSFFDLQDRLQKLYQEGMRRFLDEDVTYIDNEAIDEAFRFFKKDPDATKETIKKYFRQLKFFTNNDFAFIDVHNEKLFYQNSVVLLEIVRMLQDIQLKSEQEHQFLGDMFEGFLDQGVKQSEGQFFTPMPVVKFILKSLPLEQIIDSTEQIPKIIDYACGAGHFLNEYAQEIQPIVAKNKETDVSNYFKNIVGIEKEYRLSKVAKVSAFMYGQDDIKIVYADALSKNPEIKDNEYSVLVANPPYSVKGFLVTLDENDRNKFDLIHTIDTKSYPNNNSIEAFFIERAKQLLKPGGVAGIIVPSSILTKGKNKITSTSTNIFTATREIIIKYFDVVAIAELPQNTFGKTPTNTVTLFLRRKRENPNQADHYFNRVTAWFRNDKSKDGIFQDESLIRKYCNYLEIEFADYISLFEGSPSKGLLETDIFKEYRKEFENWTEIKNRYKHRTFRALTLNEQKAEMAKRFTEYLREAERDRLYFYVLASQNPEKVLVVKSPTSNNEVKKFLGYEWSAAKGNEGIKYLGNVIIEAKEPNQEDEGNIEMEEEDKRILSNIFNLNNINTPLYDPQKPKSESKINTLISHNFEGKEFSIPEELEPFVLRANLVDLMDFSSTNFNKKISTTVRKKLTIETKWNTERLRDLALLVRGVTYSKNDQVLNRTKNVILTADNITLEGEFEINKEVFLQNSIKIDEQKKLKKDDIFICLSSGSKSHLGKVAYIKSDTDYYFGGFMGVLRTNRRINPKFLYELLNTVVRQSIRDTGFGANINNLSDEIGEVRIPLPPNKVQLQVIAECAKIDKQSELADKIIVSERIKIEKSIKDFLNEGYPRKRISEICQMNPSKTEVSHLDGATLVSFVEMASVSEDGFITHKVNREISEVRSGGYRFFREGDIIIAKITPCMENGKCAIATDLTNRIGFGSTEFHVFEVDEKVVMNKYLFALLNREMVRKEAEKNMTGSSGHRRVPDTFYKNMSIPVPDLRKQGKLVAEIEKCQNKIVAAMMIKEATTTEKEKIVKRYL